MNKILSIVLGVSAMGSVAFAQTTTATPATTAPVADNQALAVDVSFGYESQRNFRGLTVAKDSLQTSLSLSYQTYKVGVWNHSPLRSSQSSTSEFDFTGSAGTALTDTISGEVGFTVYYFPSANKHVQDKTTFEPNVKFTFDVAEHIYVKPALMIAYDVDLENWTFEATAGHAFGLAEQLNLELNAGLGYVIADKTKNYLYGVLKADVVYSIKEPLSVFAGIRGSFNDLSKSSRGGHQKSTDFWFGVGARAAF